MNTCSFSSDFVPCTSREALRFVWFSNKNSAFIQFDDLTIIVLLLPPRRRPRPTNRTTSHGRSIYRHRRVREVLFAIVLVLEILQALLNVAVALLVRWSVRRRWRLVEFSESLRQRFDFVDER